MKKFRIYIVEDEALIAMELSDRLTQLNYEVCGRAARGERALEEIPPLQPDLVLMDIKLAGKLSGIETAACLRASLDVPVVYLSAFSDSRFVEEAVGTGAFGFLVKPFEERELHATLQATLYKHQAERLLRSDNTRLEAAVKTRTAELQQNEALLRDIFDGTSDLIQSVGPDGRILYVNRAWRETLGYTPEEVRQLNIFSLIHPDGQEHCRQAFRRLLSGEDLGLLEVAFATKAGDAVTVEGRVTVRHEHGQVISTRGIFRDVTARKAAEKALRDSEENLAVTLHSIGDAVVATDAQGRITRLNPIAEALTGWLQSEALGRPIAEVFNIITEATRKPAPIPVLATITNGTIHSLANHTVLIARDGTERPIADSCAPIRDRENRVIGAVLVFRDVTKEHADQRALAASARALRELNENLERIVAERTEKLTASERRLNHALEATSDGLWDWNIRTGDAYFSPQWVRLLGFDPAEPPGRIDVFNALIHPEDVARTLQARQEHLAGHSPALEVEIRLRTKSGGYRWYQKCGKVVARDADGAPLRMVGTIADITVRKRTEEALSDSEEMFRNVFEQSPVPIVLSHLASGAMVDFNQAALQHFGYTREQAAGRTATDLGLWDSVADRDHFVHELQTKGSVENFEATMHMQDGRILNVLFYSRVVTIKRERYAINTILDITAQRQAEVEISRLALLARETDNGVVLTDLNQRVVWANEGFSRLSGYAIEDILHRPPDDFLSGAWHDATVNAQIYAQLARHEQFTADVRNRHKSGHTYWVRLAVHPWRDHLGKTQGHFWLATDITDRVLEEQSMQLLSDAGGLGDQPDVLHHLCRHLPELLDVEACLIGLCEQPANGRYQSHGFFFQGRLQPDFSAPVAGGIAAAILDDKTAGDAEPPETRLPLPAWPELVEFAGAPLLGENNLLLGFIAVLDRHPITHRGQVETVLQRLAAKLVSQLARNQAEQMFRDLFAFASDAIMITNDKRQITDANQRMLTLFGYTREELIGQDATMLIPGPHPAGMIGWLETQLSKPETLTTNDPKSGLVARDKSGRTFPIEINISPLHTGQGTLAVTDIRDISKQVEAEEVQHLAESRLRQQQKIESIGTLAGGIAHDFNNILSAIITHSDLLRIDLPPESEGREDVECISSAAERAKRLVQQILNFSRQGEGDIEPMALGPVVTEVRNLLRATLPAMVRLDYQADPDCPLVRANPTQIHQVVMNLCTNAWHAMPEHGGRIRLKLESCALTPQQAGKLPPLAAGPHVRLVVSDNGAGMDETTLARIFDPFFTTKTPGEGTGLGLSVVHAIIQNHRGAIAVNSTPGLGTTFELYFPAVDAAGTPEPGAGNPAMPGVSLRGNANRRILLVDDEPVVGSALEKLLARQGHAVTRCTSPESALALCRENSVTFDMVITDQSMPEMTGLDLAIAIHELAPGVPILIQSGYVSASLNNAVGHHGIKQILQKPVSSKQLCDLVNRCLHDSGAADAPA